MLEFGVWNMEVLGLMVNVLGLVDGVWRVEYES